MVRRRTRVKICGITNARDAAAAVAVGADALGVVLTPSPRQVSIEQAAAALADVPPLVTRVGVFVDADPKFVDEAVTRIGLDLAQFCGAESPEACRSAPVPVVKAMHVGTTFDSETAEPYRESVTAILLDALATGLYGGTGNVFDWHLVRGLPAWAPVFLAGGLTSHNVGDAIRALRPFAVDVSSGVERRPGLKDHAKIDAFVAAVAAADLEVSTLR